MSTPTVAFDESGNTGQNLLDPGQPVFALASVHVDEAEARQLVRTFAPASYQELHFKDLRGSVVGRRCLLDVLNSPVISTDRVKITIYHKSFMVTTKIVDLLVEPLVYRLGYDLYRRGWNLALSNLLHMVLPARCGEQAFRDLQVRFVAMVRKTTPGSVDVFYAQLKTMYRRTTDAQLKDHLEMLSSTREVVPDALRAADITSLDPAIPAFIQLASLWTAQLPTRFDIIHDASKPLEHEKEILRVFMSPDEPRVLIGYDRRKAVFPIDANGITFCDSKSFPQIQLADVIAGATAYVHARVVTGSHDQFSRALLETRLAQLDVWPVWPSAAVTPEALGTTEDGGINAVDYVADVLRRHRGKSEDIPE